MTHSILTLKIRVYNSAAYYDGGIKTELNGKGGSLRETEEREHLGHSVLETRKSATDRETLCLLYELLDKTARDFLTGRGYADGETLLKEKIAKIRASQ